MYRIPHIESSPQCTFTNTVPMGPIVAPAARKRIMWLERLVDEARA